MYPWVQSMVLLVLGALVFATAQSPAPSWSDQLVALRLSAATSVSGNDQAQSDGVDPANSAGKTRIATISLFAEAEAVEDGKGVCGNEASNAELKASIAFLQQQLKRNEEEDKRISEQLKGQEASVTDLKWNIRLLQQLLYNGTTPTEICSGDGAAIAEVEKCRVALKKAQDQAQAQARAQAQAQSSCSTPTADMTPQQRRLAEGLVRASIERNTNEVRQLITLGADVNYKDAACETAMVSASRDCHTDILRMLIEAGGSVNGTMPLDITPLHWAARKGHEWCIDVLIGKRANLNAQDRMGYTPVHEAARFQKEGSVRKLLRAGAHPSIKDINGDTPYDLTTHNGIRNALKEHGHITRN